MVKNKAVSTKHRALYVAVSQFYDLVLSHHITVIDNSPYYKTARHDCFAVDL